MKFEGTYVAMVTPFTEKKEIDEGIKQAVVKGFTNPAGQNYLCAYYLRVFRKKIVFLYAERWKRGMKKHIILRFLLELLN